MSDSTSDNNDSNNNSLDLNLNHTKIKNYTRQENSKCVKGIRFLGQKNYKSPVEHERRTNEIKKKPVNHQKPTNIKKGGAISVGDSLEKTDHKQSVNLQDDHTVCFRMNFIKSILDGKKLTSMIDGSKEDSNKLEKKHYHTKNKICKDIRCILHKRMCDFHEVITQIGGRLQYIKSGTTGHTFKGYSVSQSGQTENTEKILKNPSCFNYAVKLVAYPIRERYGNPYDIRRPENAELLMIKLLSRFVIEKKTPHIVLPICTFNTDLKTFVSLTKQVLHKHKRYKSFVKKYLDGEYYDQASVLISEWANGGDLLDYLRKNYKTFTPLKWKVLFFQIISVLAVIQNKYPTFRHNDLKANNILLHMIEMTAYKKQYYGVNDCIYDVPNVGFQIKLWDFDFACIPGIVDNAKVSSEWTAKINITPDKNRYYDLHYFFNTITREEFLPKFTKAPEVPKEVREFISRIVPDKYKSGKNIAERGRILINKEYTTPDEVLKNDPYFNEFRVSEHVEKQVLEKIQKRQE